MHIPSTRGHGLPGVHDDCALVGSHNILAKVCDPTNETSEVLVRMHDGRIMSSGSILHELFLAAEILPQASVFAVLKPLSVTEHCVHGTRRQLPDTAVQNETGFSIQERVAGWEALIQGSVFHLCPRGNGPTSYRLYESLQAGTIPIYIWEEVQSARTLPSAPGAKRCSPEVLHVLPSSPASPGRKYGP